MSEQETLPAADPTESTRPPCRVCGESMDGEHHNSMTHKACKGQAAPKPNPPQTGTVKIDLTDFPPVDPEGEKHEYWVGTLEECPYQNTYAGGVCFPLFTGIATFDDKAQVMEGNISRGALAILTDDQVNAIVESVKRKAIQFVGKEIVRYVPRLKAGNGPPIKITRRRGTIVSVDGKYKRLPDDEPLAKYLYMVRTDALDFHGRDRRPEPMLRE